MAKKASRPARPLNQRLLRRVLAVFAVAVGQPREAVPEAEAEAEAPWQPGRRRASEPGSESVN